MWKRPGDAEVQQHASPSSRVLAMSPAGPSLARLGLATVATLAGAAAEVDCGASIAASCELCPAGHGALWCNGECIWLDGYIVGIGGSCMIRDPEQAMGGVVGQYVAFFITSSIITLVFACFYKNMVVDKLPFTGMHTLIKVERRERGIFACFQDPTTCLYTALCLPVVVAKNYRSMDICPFWPACILMHVGTYSPLFVFTACVRAALAGRVQERLGYKVNTLQDCVLSMFCFYCEVGRESMEVDTELGVEITCCCPTAMVKSTAEAEVENELRSVAPDEEETAPEAPMEEPSWGRSCTTPHLLCGH